MEFKRPRIIDVLRKPVKCPVCGERVVDIIYGTGDMTQIEFFLEYRQEGIVGGDNIPRRPPIWECSCGCKRFRKVNPDGTDAPVKVKLLKNLRKRPAKVINWETELAMEAVSQGKLEMVHHYEVEITTEMGEKEVLSVTGVTATDAVAEAKELVANGRATSLLFGKEAFFYNSPAPLLACKRGYLPTPNPFLQRKWLKKIIAETADYFYVLASRDDAIYYFIGYRQES